MKKIILVALLAIAALFVVACSPREALTAEEFTLRMANEGHMVLNISDTIDMPGAETYIVVEVGNVEVEFLVFETEAQARNMYNIMLGLMEDGRGTVSSHRETNAANFNRITQTSSGIFEALTRVENTLLYIFADASDRAEAEAILELLGY